MTSLSHMLDDWYGDSPWMWSGSSRDLFPLQVIRTFWAGAVTSQATNFSLVSTIRGWVLQANAGHLNL